MYFQNVRLFFQYKSDLRKYSSLSRLVSISSDDNGRIFLLMGFIQVWVIFKILIISI